MDTARIVYRDFSVDGVPSSGLHSPKKSEIRTLLAGYESIIKGLSGNGGLIYQTRALLYADLSHGDHSAAWVVGDPTVANNGIYTKNGATGLGSWSRVGGLPYDLIYGLDAGEGTANAIHVSTDIPVSGQSLVVFKLFEANTASPVTISFNGSVALTIKTASGNDVPAGAFVAGMSVIGQQNGSDFRLLSDIASGAIQAAAEAAAAAAAASASSISKATDAEAQLGTTDAKLMTPLKTFSAVRSWISGKVGAISVKDFGVVGDGSTNDTTAFQVACDAVASVGGKLFIPAGCNIKTGTINITKPLVIDGSGREGASKITAASATGDILNVTSAGFTLRDVQFDSAVSRTSGAYVKVTGAGRGSIESCTFLNYYRAIVLDGTFGFVIDNVVMLEGVPAIASAGSAGVVLGETSYTPSTTISNSSIAQSADNNDPSFGILARYVDILTISNVSVIKHGIGLAVIPSSGQFSNGIYVSNCCFDSGTTGCSIVPAGTAKYISFSNTWFGGNSSFGLYVGPTGSGTVSGIKVSACDFLANGTVGAFIGGATDGAEIMGSTFSANASHGLSMDNNINGGIVIGNKSGAIGSASANGGSGIVLGVNTDRLIVCNNIVVGNTAAQISNSSTGSHNLVSGNVAA